CLVVNHVVNVQKIQEQAKVKICWVETTEEMLQAIYEESRLSNYDVVIHASAVGDYKAEFSFRMEDLAEELFKKQQEVGGFSNPEEILAVMTAPGCKLNDNSKISSYQPNLAVKLGLTPKIISNFRAWFPKTKLIGCKLLENVPKEELFQVATKLCVKNKVDYILANDLADLRRGRSTRYVVDNSGFTGIELETPKEIFEFAIK
ncbi:MAG: phosphopantothenoylcysteine decarboxylase, partial [Anaerovorax sp.]